MVIVNFREDIKSKFKNYAVKVRYWRNEKRKSVLTQWPLWRTTKALHNDCLLGIHLNAATPAAAILHVSPWGIKT